jgi:prepilin peptidase CpaA
MEDFGRIAPAMGSFEGRTLLSFVTSLLVTACFAWTILGSMNERTPLFQSVGIAVFLFLIMFEDMRSMRIPNPLNFTALALALALGLVTGGAPGLIGAVSGVLLAFALFFLPFLFGWLGAGDVKAMMVLGALYGPGQLVGLGWWTLVTGGVIALCFVAFHRGGLRDLLGRWSRSFWFSLRTGRLVYLPPKPGTASAAGLPCAVAMGLGAVALNFLGTPWS